MADENGRAETGEQEGTDAQQVTEPDYKALYEQAKSHSREWERKAKANKVAADELEKLKASQMTDQR